MKMDSFEDGTSYQEFLDDINGMEDLNDLKRKRFNILTEIVQATTMSSNVQARQQVTNSPNNSQQVSIIFFKFTSSGVCCIIKYFLAGTVAALHWPTCSRQNRVRPPTERDRIGRPTV